MRICWLVLGGLALLYAVPCILFLGFANAGTFFIAAVGALALLYPAFYARVSRRARILFGVLWCVGLLLMTLLTGVMLYAARVAVPDPLRPPGTVIVLGAKLEGDRPSLILERRLHAALDYLLAHPEAAVVVSGGLGAGEAHTESSVMRAWLIQNGIAADRIFEEDTSAATSENLAFSARVIRENGLDTDVAISTDGFHQLRAALFAHKNGLRPSALRSATPPGLVPMYLVREWFGIVKAVLLGS